MLRGMQVPEEVILFVENSDGKLRGKMIAKLKENPQATIDDLKKLSVVEKESWDISLAKLLKKYQEGNLENYPMDDNLIASTVEEAKELNKNLGGQIKFEISFPAISLTVGNNVYIYDDTSIEKSIASFLQKLHSLTGNYEWETYIRSKPSNSDAADIKTGIIEVVKCESRQDLVKYGAGEKWCVCDPSSASHYIRYKVNLNGTFYMVFDGLKNNDDPAKKVLITIGKNNKAIEYADTRNDKRINGYNNLDEYYEYLEKESNGIITKQLFVNDPMSNEERNIIEKVKNKNENTEWFANLSPTEQTYYISMGYDLTNDQFDIVMRTDLSWSKNTILDTYVTAGKSLPTHQLNKLNNYNTDFIKSYKVSRETYLENFKQKFENKPEQLIQFAFRTFDRELLLELYKENKLNDHQVSEMFTRFFKEEDQFYIRLGLESSEVLPKIDWVKVIIKNNTPDENYINKYKQYFNEDVWNEIFIYKLVWNTLDENFENKYKDKLNEILPKIDWWEVILHKGRKNNVDENFIDKYRQYFNEAVWLQMVNDKLCLGTLDENFENKYKDDLDKILPKINWKALIEKIEYMFDKPLEENFIDKYKQYFNEDAWKKIIDRKLLNNTFDENFIDKYRQYFNEGVWLHIVDDKLSNRTLDENFINKYKDVLDKILPKIYWLNFLGPINSTLDENFIDKYKQYFDEDAWNDIVYNQIIYGKLSVNFQNKYKDELDKILPKMDWKDIIEQIKYKNMFDENFIDRFKEFLGSGWSNVIEFMLEYEKPNLDLNQDFIDKYQQYFDKDAWMRIIKHIYYKKRARTLGKDFIDNYKQYFDEDVWRLIIDHEHSLDELDEKFINNYKGYFGEAWDEIVQKKLQYGTLDEDFIDKHKEYFNESSWHHIVVNYLFHGNLSENFVIKYKEYVDKILLNFDWHSLLSAKMRAGLLDENFINNFTKFYFDNQQDNERDNEQDALAFKDYLRKWNPTQN